MYDMLTWLWNILIGCSHKWKIIDERDFSDYDGRRIGTSYYLQCEKCGNVKRKLP